MNHLASLRINTSDICVLGGDGTVSNTGWKGGSMAHIEKILGRPCQRVVCLLHHCELPLRKLFEFLDGSTSGPNSFSGTVGKMIAKNVWEEKPINFEPLNMKDFPKLTVEVEKNLSNDAKHLHQLAVQVNTGSLTKNAMKKKIGPLCHSRWLTLATRILRLYIALSPNNTVFSKIKKLARYIIGVYWKMHINVKHRSSILQAPMHVCDELNSINALVSEPAEKKLLHESLQRNCYPAHPENLLLAMLGDDDSSIRARAVKLIKNIRQTNSALPSNDVMPIRDFYLPMLNVNAQHYSELITIKENGGEPALYLSNNKGYVKLTEPPLLKDCSDLNQFFQSPLQLTYPSHTQSVERAVKLTTESSSLNQLLHKPHVSLLCCSIFPLCLAIQLILNHYCMLTCIIQCYLCSMVKKCRSTLNRYQNLYAHRRSPNFQNFKVG